MALFSTVLRIYKLPLDLGELVGSQDFFSNQESNFGQLWGL